MFRSRAVCCPPQYVVRDFYRPRVVPHIHPVEIIHRQNIVNVPRHVYRPVVKNVVNDPGLPTHAHCCKNHRLY
ncbi:MAG TPA: hypothetical protein VK119_07525 [Bacillota bacterium]|nr:hypothetical protein [Bacillota bacterium]